MPHQTVELTPAHISFLSATIPGYSADTWTAESAGAAGSDRRFVRVRPPNGGQSLVLVIWDSRDRDWGRFIAIERDLRPHVDLLPRIYHCDETHGLIVEEDLGDSTLGKVCARADAQRVESVYSLVVEALARWQEIDPAHSDVIRARRMDEEMLLWETEYFARHCVTEYFGCEELLTAEWEKQRTEIARQAALLGGVCMHRDFQSENILIKDNRPRFVDFQGARLGPALYDLASLLFDPYAGYLDPPLVQRLVECYRAEVRRDFEERELVLCGAQRLMQALGAYGNLSLHKGKRRYRRYVGPALERLEALVRERPGFEQVSIVARACLECQRKHNSAAPGQ